MTTPLKLASRLDPIKPSITLAVTAKAAKMKADGIDVVSFGAGTSPVTSPPRLATSLTSELET
jgi:aspartate aminotransferase